jgi:hypothetical protein
MSADELLHRTIAPFAWLPLIVAMIAGPLAVWWMLEPPPVELRYVAPHFTDRPVESRAEAERHAIKSTPGGSVVYRYIEYCVRKPFVGEARRSWVNSAMVWHAPSVPTVLSREVGCRSAAVSVEVPTSNPSRSFQFVQAMEVQVNPIRTDRIEYPPIPLTILANK